MKHFAFGVCLLAVLGLYLGCEFGVEQSAEAVVEQRPEHPVPAAQGRLAKGHLQFVSGYRQGYSESVRQSKPMMLFFTASWCGYCRQMADEAFTHPQVVSLSNQFVCVLIDADEESDVCRQFHVTGYPTIQFLSPRGVPLERVVGKKPGHQVMMAMQSALQHVARRTGGTETEVQ